MDRTTFLCLAETWVCPFLGFVLNLNNFLSKVPKNLVNLQYSDKCATLKFILFQPTIWFIKKPLFVISEDSLRIKIHKSLILRFYIIPLFLFMTHHHWVINMNHPLNRSSSALRVISSFGMKKKKTKNVF